QTGVECRDDGAVLRRIGIEMAHRRHAGGPRHVLHDDGRLAGDVTDVTAKMAGEKPRVLVVAAAGRVADHDGYGPALVEWILRNGSFRRGRKERQRNRQ